MLRIIVLQFLSCRERRPDGQIAGPDRLRGAMSQRAATPWQGELRAALGERAPHASCQTAAEKRK